MGIGWGKDGMNGLFDDVPGGSCGMPAVPLILSICDVSSQSLTIGKFQFTMIDVEKHVDSG